MNQRKNEIDNFINDFNENHLNVNMIYGGATDKNIFHRKNEHINENNNFDNMHIKKVTSDISSYNNIKELEQYLINKLDEKFGDKCINDRNNNGEIAQRGGNGLNPDSEHYRLYVMWK
jgi:hypothetical protein